MLYQASDVQHRTEPLPMHVDVNAYHFTMQAAVNARTPR